MNLNKRIDKLESVTSEKNFKTYAELLKAERTKGTKEHAEREALYNDLCFDRVFTYAKKGKIDVPNFLKSGYKGDEY